MNTEFAPFAHDHAFAEMMKCFEELSLRERLKRTLRGLNQPKSSGDYKFAVLQIQRMTGPFLAVALPMLAIILLLGVETEEQVAFRVRPITYIEVEPPPDIGYWDSPSASEHHGGGGAPIEAVAWNDGKEVPVKGTLGGRVQDTALCALQLMVFYRYLPTFQAPGAFADADIGIDDKADVRVNIVL